MSRRKLITGKIRGKKGEKRKILTNAAIHPTLPAVDIGCARKFYEGTLGLKVLQTDPSPGIMFQAGEGTTFYVYQWEATKAEHTSASFTVKDVEASVKELKAKGVTLEEYDLPWMKTVDSIATMGMVKGA